jgi:hypothetical protein
MEENRDPKFTLLLEDDPSTSDQFGGHDRVANVIVDTMLNELGGKILSVQGIWGSGKSTVIRFIEDKLAKSSSELDFNIFCFDSWIHEQDPLRRAFLDEIIDFLNAKGLLSKKTKIKKKDVLSKRVKEEKTRTIPEITSEGKILGAISLLVPVGLILISESLGKGSFIKESWWWWGLTLSLSPFLAGLLIYLQKLICSEDNSGLNIFLSNQTVTNLTKTYESPEPSSIEFERHF